MKTPALLLCALLALSSCKTIPLPTGGDDDRYEPNSGDAFSYGTDKDPSDGKIVWSKAGETIELKQTITVESGEVFDGRLSDGSLMQFTAHSGTMGSGNQDEGQKPLFILEAGAELRNVIIGDWTKSAADGVHVRLDRGNGGKNAEARIMNVEWRNVGEDALTLKSGKGKVLVRKSKFAYASDKAIQFGDSADIELLAEECQWFRCQKGIRSGNNPGTEQYMEVQGGSGRYLSTLVYAAHQGARGKIRGFKRFNITGTFAVEKNGGDVDE